VRLICLASVAGLALATGCTGNIDPPPGESGKPPHPVDNEAPPSGAFATVGIMDPRLLSQYEFAGSAEYLFEAKLPQDEIDNDPATSALYASAAGSQSASAQPIEWAARFIAEGICTRLRSDVARRNRVVGCTPTGIADRGCMTSFVTRFGRRALRRPLRPEE